MEAAIELLTGKALYLKVREHLLKQKQVAQDCGMCSYRVGELKCAAGCLISDANYRAELEGIGLQNYGDDCRNGIRKNKVWAAIFASGVADTPDNRELIRELQAIHDYTDPPNWKWRLDDLAETKGWA